MKQIRAKLSIKLALFVCLYVRKIQQSSIDHKGSSITIHALKQNMTTLNKDLI